MSVIIFLIILSALVFVHELGHFLAAKKFGIRVDEFALGLPPKALKLFRWRGTDFTLNWLPFGGFVKIFGENPEEGEPLTPDSFQAQNRAKQAAVLVAGVFGNFLFAWFLISIGFMSGLPAPAGTSLPVENPHTVVTTVLPGSPADKAGLHSGDTLLGIKSTEGEAQLSPIEASQFIGVSDGELIFTVERGGTTETLFVTPESGIIPDKKAVGISMDVIGVVKLNPFSAVYHGLITTAELTVLTAKALGSFVLHAFIGRADLSQVTGPVGLVGMVGDVSSLGFVYLLSFTALISINLAIINLVPFPALDGGRLLFVVIEAIRRKAVSPRIFNMVNTAGFALLILLMILITIRDVQHIL